MVTVTVLYAGTDGRSADERLDALVARLADEHRGTVERTAADGHMCAFGSARLGLECAVALQRAVAAEELAIGLRVGLHSGDLERRDDGRLQGRAIAKAARIAALAHAGEILVSSVVRELADADADIRFDDGREVELRGIPGRHLVLPVAWSEHATAPVRVVIADDAAIVRDGVAALLREHGLDVVATASDAAGLEEAVARERPDVAIVDIRMPPTFTNEGLVAAESIRRTHPGTGVLVLSQHVEPSYAIGLVRESPERRGYLLKERVAETEVLLDAVRRVARGDCVVDAGMTDRLMRGADARGLLDELSDREREVLELIAQGLSNRAIAERLVVSARTVETHVGQIFLKLGLGEEGQEHRRVAAVITYLRASRSA